MPTQTPNHGYLTFADGEEPWGWRPNFEQLEIDIPIVAPDTERANHTAHANALYIAHDTGAVYRGDGTSWIQIGSLAEETTTATAQAEGDSDGSGEITAQAVSSTVEGVETRRDHIGPFHSGGYHENPGLWGVHFAAQPELRIESVVLDFDEGNSVGNQVTIELWESTVDSSPGHPNPVAPTGVTTPEYSVTRTLTDGPQRVSLGFQTPTTPTTGEFFLGVEGADIHLRRIQNWTGWAAHTSPRIDLQFSGRFNNPTTGDYSDYYYRVFDMEIGDPYSQITSPWSTDVDEIYVRPTDPAEEFDDISPRALWVDTSS